MMKFLTAITFLCASVLFAMSADARNTSGREGDSKKIAESEELTYASVSRTNPFEVVPAAGMELLDDIDGGVDQAMLSDMITFARKFLGTRYVRGGKSPKGFDCSGFTSYVFRQFGYELNASSSAQYGQGVKIERDEVSTGDLLFFTGRNSGSGRVGHVGIAIDNDPVTGEITFIHAAIGGGIRIDRISSAYYSKRYIGARRVF